MRALHRFDPEAFSTPLLAARFKISPEAVRRILKSRWEPDEKREKEMAERDEKRKKERSERRKLVNGAMQAQRKPKKMAKEEDYQFALR